MYFISVFILILISFGSNAQLYINEMMASNNNCIFDEDGDNPDWIEIFNSGDKQYCLGSYFLSDDDSNLKKWQFPNVCIDAGEFLVVFASGKNRLSDINYLHTNFRINKGGEPIILSNPDGEIIDRLPPAFVETDFSYGRFPDGRDSLVIFKSPSPGNPNSGSTATPQNIMLDFSRNQGFYEYDFLLQIQSSKPTEIRFTTDGSAPTPDSEVYSNAISINSRVGDENYFSEIPSSEKNYWKPPKSEIKKLWTIRARAFENNIPISNEIWGSFWVSHSNPLNNNLPIVSIFTDSYNFFDYQEGIYVPGIDYDEFGDGNFFRRGRETEKETCFTFFDSLGNAVVNQKVGVRIHGAATRKYPQKSLRLYARNSYGEEYFNYKFFPYRDNDKFKRLLLSSTMKDDWTKALFKDELGTYLVRGLNLDYLEFIPVKVFLNGEYWGIHYLKERRDKYYLAQNHLVDYDNIDRISNNSITVSGSSSHYFYMINFLESSNPNENETFMELKKMMDVDSYIDYMCMQIYFNNRDWPHNNVECWRPSTSEGKWRWIFWDLDRAFEEPAMDNLSIYKDFEDSYRKFRLFRLLLQIPEFESLFLNRLYWHMENTVSPNKVLDAIEYFEQTLSPNIPEHINRWQFPLTVYEWEQNVQSLRDFAILRPAEMAKIIQKVFNNPFFLHPNPVGESLFISSDLISENNGYLLYSIYGICGKKIIAGKEFLYDISKLEIDVSHLKNGIYVLVIQLDSRVFNLKFVKM